MVVGEGSPTHLLSRDTIRRIVETALPFAAVAGHRVLAIIPDGTRTMPMPLMADVLERVARRRMSRARLSGRARHAPADDRRAAVGALSAARSSTDAAGGSRMFNHRWDDPATFVTLGTIRRDEIAALTGGLLARDVPVALNRLVLEYDHIVICGPVFPHEVVGFSGGTKYFCPGHRGPGHHRFHALARRAA